MKEFTSKDIESIKKWYSNRPVGYKLNGIYLLKDYYGLGQTEHYTWIITKKEHGYSFYVDKERAIKNGEVITVSNFKEGKAKLIELANKNIEGKVINC